MNIFKGLIPTLVACLIFSQPAFSQSEFKPAKLREADNILEKIAFPRKGGDVNRVFPCNIQLLLNGRIARIHCNLKDAAGSDWMYERAVYKALNGARMERAKVDGKSQSVGLNITVAFIRKGAEEVVEIHLNHATEFEKYGINYSDPQRLINRLGPVISMKRCNADTNVWVKSTVDVEGKPNAIEIAGGIATDVCKESILKQYRNVLFIPAHDEGVPVEAIFFESIVGSYGSAILKRHENDLRESIYNGGRL